MDLHYENGNFEAKEVSSRELTLEDYQNDNFTVGDEEVNMYKGTDIRKLNSLK